MFSVELASGDCQLVRLRPSNLVVRVRFPSPAPTRALVDSLSARVLRGLERLVPLSCLYPVRLNDSLLTPPSCRCAACRTWRAPEELGPTAGCKPAGYCPGSAPLSTKCALIWTSVLPRPRRAVPSAPVSANPVHIVCTHARIASSPQAVPTAAGHGVDVTKLEDPGGDGADGESRVGPRGAPTTAFLCSRHAPVQACTSPELLGSGPTRSLRLSRVSVPGARARRIGLS